MTKELQDLVWSILPKEFKEDVKEIYDSGIKMMDIRPSASQIYANKLSTLEGIFGIHNLTSDAEGEEMLTVPRKDIVELYQEVQKTINQCKGTELAIQAIGIKNTIWSFFGSKCLLDETVTDCHQLQEPKPAEPKFKVGDRMYIKYINKIGTIDIVEGYKEEEDGIYYHLKVEPKGSATAREELLEPYTGPQSDTSQKSENAKGLFEQDFAGISSHGVPDHIADTGKMVRLNIAAMITASIYSSDTIAKQFNSIEHVVRMALDIADTLIAEAESSTESLCSAKKGGDK